MDDHAQDLADKAEIVELMTRYCFAVDFRDFEALREVFTTEAEATYVLSPLGLGLEDVHLSGADAIVEWLSSVLGSLGEPGSAPRDDELPHRGARRPRSLAELPHERWALHRRPRAHARRLARGAMGDAQLPAPYSSAWLIAHAALIRPMWLKACGKFPRSSPVAASTSSARRPTSLT